MYRYDKPLRPEQVHVHLWERESRSAFPELRAGITAAAHRYGFTFSAVGRADLASSAVPPDEHRLLIVLSSTPFDEGLTMEVLEALKKGYSNASIAFNYSSEQEMLASREAIEHFKSISQDRINFLRPVRCEDGTLKVPIAKIIDNSICDSVRIKYVPHKRGSEFPLSDEARQFFVSAGEIFAKERLYHRSSTDGYFAFRPAGGDGFYITATKTSKVDLRMDRISYVHKYDRARNVIEYSGAFLPSSDAVEAAVLLEAMPSIQSLVHTHASDLFTRNPLYSHKVTVPVLPYGEAALGDALAGALVTEGDGFVIMEDHGEIFASFDESLPTSLINELQDVLRDRAA